MNILFDALFSSMAFGHLFIDLLNGQRAVLMTYLSVALGLTNTQLGFYSTLFMMAGSLAQPVFGYLTDRWGPRWPAAGGLLWMGAFFSLALLTPGTAALWMLILASLGSAAFHPAGTMQATMRGRTHFSGRETTSAAYFFFFGQAGHFLGPIMAGPLLGRFGPLGLVALAAPAAVAGLNAAYQLRPSTLSLAPAVPNVSGASAGETISAQVAAVSAESPVASRQRRSWLNRRRLLAVLPFALLAAFQAWSQQNVTTFLPKLLADLGQQPATYGFVAALFMGGSALGNTLGGTLADRFGKRRVASTSLGLATIPLVLIGIVGWSPWLYIVVPLAGALTGSTHSIIVVLAQRLIPNGMALASGLILGFMFSSGALGTLLSGYLADQVGLPLIFFLSAAIALGASLMALTIRPDSQVDHTEQ